jgi:hypothetical protein
VGQYQVRLVLEAVSEMTLVHFCSGTLSRQDFCEEWTQSCQIQPQLVQPLTVNASKSTQEAVTKRRSVMFQNMTGEAADF